MLRIRHDYFVNRTIKETAQTAGVEPETLSRIVNGQQRPGFGQGQSAERIAQALGFEGDPRELFEEVGE